MKVMIKHYLNKTVSLTALAFKRGSLYNKSLSDGMLESNPNKGFSFNISKSQNMGITR
jgi:hypothetical protein